jgi:hypothetical protein
VDAVGPVGWSCGCRGSDTEEVVDHHVAAFVNRTYVGETVFDAKLPHRLEAVVPASALVEKRTS